MAENISTMNEVVPKETFELVARQLGTLPSFIEKDWHITKVLKAISSIKNSEFDFIFSGGTALSKAHQLIERFSEDIDFIIIPKRKDLNRISRSKLKKDVISNLEDVRFSIDKDKVLARNENRFFVIHLDYPTYFDRANSLRPHIQIEMTISETQLAPIKLQVSSLVSKLSNQKPEIDFLNCMNVVENAANKLSALTWRIADRVRGQENDDPSIIRHLYDLAKLKDNCVKDGNFKNLVINSMSHDEGREKNNSEFFSLSYQEKIQLLIKILSTDEEYQKEYDRYVKGVCYCEDDKIPSYRDCIQVVKSLALLLF